MQLSSLFETAAGSWPSIATAFVGAIWLVLVLRKYSTLADIPGPFAASFTRLWHVWHIIVGDQNLKLIQLHKKHGHFVRVAPNEVSVGHPEGIKKVFLASLRKGDWYSSTKIPDWRWKNPMAELDPKKKVEFSKKFAPAYHMGNLLKSETAVNEVVGKLCQWMDKYADNREPMHLDKFFTFAAFDVVGEVLFSKQFGFIESGTDVGNSIRNAVSLNIYVAIIGFYPYIHLLFANPFVTWAQLMPYGHLYNTTFQAIAARRANPDARYDLMEHWFKVHDEHPERLSMRDIEGHSLQDVGAGSDTTSCGLQSFVYYTIRSPSGNYWQRLRDEIKEAQAQGRCLDRIVSFADAQKLPYLQACIKEALRVTSPAPMGLPRVAPPGGLTIGDKTFPAGTILSINAWVMHYSEEIWGPDAAEFNPDRWLGEDAATLERYFMPWGQGYASCPGQNIAKLEFSKITATIVRDYDIRQVDPNQQWQWKARFAMVPHSWPVYITKVQSS